jgi:hypothetical protein
MKGGFVVNTKVIISLLEGVLRVLSRWLYKWRERVSDSTGLSESAKDRSFSVVITTHSRRFFSGALPLLESLRASSAFEDVPIYLVVNADTFGDFDFDLRSKFLAKACSLGNVFPVCLGEPAGMSELWNTGIESAGTEKILVLSDDLTILEPGLVELRSKVETALDKEPLVVANQSWGHFAISRTALTAVGWFDERLLGFGEEDGDYTQRYGSVFGKSPAQVEIFGVNNVSSQSGFEEVVKGSGKYSLFNRALVTLKYQSDDWNGFEQPSKLDPIVGDELGNPSWEFKQRFRYLLSETDAGEIRRTLGDYFNQPGK